MYKRGGFIKAEICLNNQYKNIALTHQVKSFFIKHSFVTIKKKVMLMKECLNNQKKIKKLVLLR